MECPDSGGGSEPRRSGSDGRARRTATVGADRQADQRGIPERSIHACGQHHESGANAPSSGASAQCATASSRPDRTSRITACGQEAASAKGAGTCAPCGRAGSAHSAAGARSNTARGEQLTLSNSPPARYC